MAIEEPLFEVETKYEHFEVRKYNKQLVAQVYVNEAFEDAGNKAFRLLADYIFGNNQAQVKIAMTAPVTQQSEKIAMTAPVSMQKSDQGYLVQFMMPVKYNLETIPRPIDQKIQLVELPARRVAVYTYSGFWSESRYQAKLAEFSSQLAKTNLQLKGDPIFARFNSPFQLWFLRRNEIWRELE